MTILYYTYYIICVNYTVYCLKLEVVRTGSGIPGVIVDCSYPW